MPNTHGTWKLLKLVHIALLTAAGFVFISIAAPGHSKAATEESLALIDFGKEYIGTPYQFGVKSGITSAFDCSSFIQYVFKDSGIALPRSSAAQAKVGTKVDKGSLSVGDLVFFKTNGKSISHVGIYAGNNKMLHSSSSKGVTISSLNTSYWTKNYVTARRVKI
ncbi:cell wall-associated NlpC family hydrolase [Paenibacillus phyllosphaerae]|uniref:Cell wall-associated NlpC family hydrolase n=1 Tax=Paenibacillus phyllosphaerae TaxID=274593 RepID=A0A7W5AUG7_9BACL|nr:C40 family peptidase [Paenibacillus phyllosphaerae]MBB3108993.1 cell wall-associated NlpC family hydrolase [Paenibacillus phyllosphaerae]